jgi:hypothetical protein
MVIVMVDVISHLPGSISRPSALAFTTKNMAAEVANNANFLMMIPFR